MYMFIAFDYSLRETGISLRHWCTSSGVWLSLALVMQAKGNGPNVKQVFSTIA
jgi:hypothetical protein